MEIDFSAMAPSQEGFFPPKATVSLAETNFVVPNTPDSLCSTKDEDEKRPTKKRKSWGQELPTPKTNLPPRSATASMHTVVADQLLTRSQKTSQDGR